MPSNVNISDYEKIIFVNNINEEDSAQKSMLANAAFNFALFFANNTNLPNNWPSTWGNKIQNIWYKGQRLNRFIGIDPNNCVFTTDGHTFKLNFNYEKGLLGITDTNKLESITFAGITYIDAYTNSNISVDATDVNNIGVINSKNNTFTLSLKFKVKDEAGANANAINTDINIDSETNVAGDNNIDSFEYVGTTVNEVSNDTGGIVSVIRNYKVKIGYDTERNSNSVKLYTISSIYDSTKTLPLNLTFRLNPEEITIKRGNVIIGNNDSFTSGTTAENKTYNVLFTPNKNGNVDSFPQSHSNRRLYVKVTSSNSDVASVETTNPIIVDNDTSFILSVKPVADSSNSSATITVEVYHDNITNSENKFTALTKTFTVNVGTIPGIVVNDIGNNTLRAVSNNTSINADWSISNTNIVLSPLSGITTGYSLSSSVANPKGTYSISLDKSSINLGESVTITVSFTKGSKIYSGTVTAAKTGYISGTRDISLTKYSTIPSSVKLTNGSTVPLNSSGVGTLTYTPTEAGIFEIGTNDSNHNNRSTSLTVVNNQPTSSYYWYAGSTVPTAENISTIATGSSVSKPSWTTENPQSIAATNDTGASTYLYYSFPTEWNVVTLDVDKVTEMQLINEGTFIYNGTEYSILRTGRTISNGTTKNYWAKMSNDIIIPPQPTSNYYWYSGTTVPSASNINSIATGSSSSKPNWTTENPQSIAATNNTNESTYLYYSFPTEWNVVTLDVDKVTEMQLASEGTFIYNETEYSILRTGRKIAVGTTKNYWAKC